MRMVPRGHLSMHPTALEIAGSSISISPVLPLDAPLPFPRPFSHAPAAADPAAAGRQWSSSMLEPPSSFPYRPIPRSSNSRSSSHISSSSSSSTTTTTSVAAEPRPAHLLSTTTPSSLPQPQDFLQKRRAQAAAHYLRPDDENMDAIFKRRAQVDYAVGRAKERIAQLGLKCPSKKHHGKGCMANLRRQIQMIKDNPFWGLWGEQLKEIEGSFGSAVMITFAFLRWVFFLNVCLSMLWIGAIVIPFFLHPPSSYQWTGIKQYFQANGLEKTWILFGGYFYKSEQTGWYRTDYVYPCTIAVMFLISLVAILATIARRIMGSGDATLVYTSDTFPYATVVFTAWDFRITSLEAATKLRKGIRMQLREMLADSVLRDHKLDEESPLKYYKRYAVLGLLWPMVMAGTIAAVYFLVSKSEIINSKLKTGYAQAALMTILVSIVGPFLVRTLVKLEDWKPAVAERVVIVKLFFLRALNLSTFLYRLYVMLQNGYFSTQGLISDPCIGSSKCPRDGFLCCNSPSDGEWGTCLTQTTGFCASKCMENEVGKQIMKLIITSAVINSLLDIGMGIIFTMLLHKEQELSIPDYAIDIVYMQVLVWTGSHFSPMASTAGVLCNLLTFYSKKLTLKTCTSTQKLYSASRTSVLTYGVLLVALLLCVIPEAVFVTTLSSGICGPIEATESMYNVVAHYIGRAGYPLGAILEWIGSPVILCGVIILLVFIIVLLRAKLVQSYQYLELRTKEQDIDSNLNDSD